MKIAALITAVVLASGTAFAAQAATSYDKQDSVSHSTAAAHESQPKQGIVERTKSAIRRMGEKLGHATERLTHKRSDSTDQAAANDHRSDTRSMGAAGSDDSRQRRMDQAYNNWHSKQK